MVTTTVTVYRVVKEHDEFPLFDTLFWFECLNIVKRTLFEKLTEFKETI